LILSNIETIYEDPSFGDLMKRKANLFQLVESLNDVNARQQLSNFMKVYIETGVFMLKFIDSQYWLDKPNKIQNEFSLDSCIVNAINIGVAKLKKDRMILDITNSEALAKDTIENGLNKDLNRRKKDIGLIQTKAIAKDNKRNKRNKK